MIRHRGTQGHGLGQLHRDRVGHATWPAPRAIMPTQDPVTGFVGWTYRPRLVDYARTPEPTLTGELLRRSFLEGA